MTRFRLRDRGGSDDCHFTDLTVERSGAAPEFIGSLILPADLAAELVRQVQLLNDVLDLEGGGAACPAA